jgi:ribosomal protein S12 methylthiotransferase accessory factor
VAFSILKNSKLKCYKMDELPNNIFADCAKFLRTRGNRSSNDAVREFLAEIECNSPTKRDQILPLFEIVARFDRAFRLPMNKAPGMFHFGGLVRPEAYGNYLHGNVVESVGGRGGNFAQAFESAAGEAAEYLSFIEWENDPLRKDRNGKQRLSENYFGWCLSGIGLDDRHELGKWDWVEAKSLSGNGNTDFPAELILRLPEARRKGVRQAESSGVGAGPTLASAIASGLYEVIERDAIALWCFGGVPAKRVDDDVLRGNGVHDLITDIRRGFSRRQWFLDISTDLSIPVVASLSSEEDGSGVVAGFAARSKMDDAMRVAFLENCQMELAQDLMLMKLAHVDESALVPQDKVWLERYRKLSLDSFPEMMGEPDLDGAVESAALEGTEDVVTRLADQGYMAWFCDLQRKEIGVPVARVIVPGLQSIKPDWVTQRLKKAAMRNGKGIENFSCRLSLI